MHKATRRRNNTRLQKNANLSFVFSAAGEILFFLCGRVSLFFGPPGQGRIPLADAQTDGLKTNKSPRRRTKKNHSRGPCPIQKTQKTLFFVILMRCCSFSKCPGCSDCFPPVACHFFFRGRGWFFASRRFFPRPGICFLVFTPTVFFFCPPDQGRTPGPMHKPTGQGKTNRRPHKKSSRRGKEKSPQGHTAPFKRRRRKYQVLQLGGAVVLFPSAHAAQIVFSAAGDFFRGRRNGNCRVSQGGQAHQPILISYF